MLKDGVDASSTLARSTYDVCCALLPVAPILDCVPVTTVEVACALCGVRFLRSAAEQRHLVKCGKTRFFCGLACAGAARRAPLAVADAIRLYAAGESQAAIGRCFGVTRVAVQRALARAGVVCRTAVAASDLLRRRTFDVTDRVCELIDGLLLGDAWVEVSGSSEGRLCLEQRADRGDWLSLVEHEFQLVGVVCSLSTRPPRTSVILGKACRSRGSILLRTRKYRPFTGERRRWYPCGLKRVPADVRLTPAAIAH